MTDTQRLVDRPSYELGKQHYRAGISDFHRRSLFGDERRAYMLGRSHAMTEAHRQQREKTG